MSGSFYWLFPASHKKDLSGKRGPFYFLSSLLRFDKDKGFPVSASFHHTQFLNDFTLYNVENARIEGEIKGEAFGYDEKSVTFALDFRDNIKSNLLIKTTLSQTI